MLTGVLQQILTCSSPTEPTNASNPKPSLQDLPSDLLVRIAHIIGRQHIALLCKDLAARLAIAAPPATVVPEGPVHPRACTLTLTSLIQHHGCTLTTLDLSNVGHILHPKHARLLLSTTSLPRLASLTLRRYSWDHPTQFETLPFAPSLTHLALLSGTPPVSPACLAHICASAPSLRSLSLTLGTWVNRLESERPHPAPLGPREHGPQDYTSLGALSTLSHLTHLWLSAAGSVWLSQDASNLLLATTASLPALQSLLLDSSVELAAGAAAWQQLARHTLLTAVALCTEPTQASEVEPLLQALGSLVRLQRLRLLGWDAQFTQSAPALEQCLRQLTALRSLEVRGAILLDLRWPAAMWGSTLTQLVASLPHPEGASQLLPLAACLRALDLSTDEALSVPALQAVVQLTALTRLSLCSLRSIGPAVAGRSVPSLRPLAPSLKSLSLKSAIGSDILSTVRNASSILQPLTGLTYLSLDNVHMTDKVLAGGGWLAGMRQLRWLSLFGVEGLEGRGLRVLYKLPQLAEVALPGQCCYKRMFSSRLMTSYVQFLVPPPPTLRRVWWRSGRSHCYEEMQEQLGQHGVEVALAEGCWTGRELPVDCVD